MLPLIIQMALISKFVQLYDQSEKAAAASERYGEVIQTLVEMDGQLFKLVEIFYGVKLDVHNAASARDIIIKARKDFDPPIVKLRQLAQDDPQSLTILAKLEYVRDNFASTVEHMAGQILTGLNGVDKAILARQFANVARTASMTLPEAESELQKLADRKRLESVHLKDEQRPMIILFAAIDFGFAALAMVALLTSTSSKLRKLRANVESYAHEKKLSPPGSGHDEIDVIDRAFYEAASSLRILHRKERALIYDSQDPIVFLDRRGLILFANHAAALHLEEGSSFLDAVQPAERAAVLAFLKAVNAGSDKLHIETTLELGQASPRDTVGGA